MYSKCRSMSLARHVFDHITRRDATTWNSLILGYVENGDNLVAIDMFTAMDCQPDRVTYIAALKACVTRESEKKVFLSHGLAIHKQIIDRGFISDLVVANTLVEMYGKCGCMHQAKEVFDKMVKKDAVTWTCLIHGYVENGESFLAMELFASMDCEPSRVTYIAVLKACAVSALRVSEKQLSLEKGITIHKQIKDRGLESDIVVANSLLNMYGKCGSMYHAREVFESMLQKDVITWTSLITGYVENEENSLAMDTFTRMECAPNHVTYVSVLKACAGLKDSLEKGIAIHREVTSRGFDTYIVVANTLVDMYGKCRSMQHAQEVFNRMVHKDSVTWTCLIMGYVENGENSVAIDYFTKMDCEPNRVTYIGVLKALASEREAEKHSRLEKGEAIHHRLKERGLDTDASVANTLLDMYAKCGSMERAQEVFNRMICKNVVTWTCLIVGYVENEEGLKALDFFAAMDCEPDIVTYAAVLKACDILPCERDSEKQVCLEKAMEIHKQAKERGLDSDVVLISILVGVYSKCGSVEHAMDVFVNMECEADSYTYVAVIKACCSVSSLLTAKCIHAKVCSLGIEQNGVVATALVDLYAKCGCMSTAVELFNGMQSHDIVTWNALLAGFSSTGDFTRVFELTRSVEETGVKMNYVTYICILTACSHTGLVHEGKRHFMHMLGQGITPTIEHYGCMVDMLGRANMLEEALNVLENMPMEASTNTWLSLLGACRKWKNVEVGKVAFDKLVGRDKQDAAAYVLMGDIYRSLNMCQDWEQIKETQNKLW